jgi:ABC-2 type transport system permease protein
MSVVLLRQMLRSRRWSMVGWSLGWLVLACLYAATWPTVRDHASSYDQILQDLPAALRAAIGAEGSGTFSTAAGYLTAELLSFTGPVLATALGVLLGAKVTAESEQDGTLELLLAQPLSRARVLLTRTAGATCEIVLELTVAGLGLWLVGQLVDLGLGPVPCLRATSMLALTALLWLSLTVLVAAVTGRTGVSRGTVGALAGAAFVLNALGPSLDAVRHAVFLSPYHVLMASDPFRQVPDPLRLVAFVGPATLAVGLAAWSFTRRDLRLR